MLTKKGTRAMNAIELANKLEDYFDSDYDEIVTMLRQQQAEIEVLKAKLNYAKETIESIVWTDRKPFDDSGWASVSFSALAKGADCLRKIQEK